MCSRTEQRPAGWFRLQHPERDQPSLESYGLGHLPRELPPNQEDPVRLYLLGSPVADVIKAVLTPSDEGDDTLRSVSTSEAQEQLHQIRQIVCG